MHAIELLEISERKSIQFPFHTYHYDSIGNEHVFAPHWHDEIEITVATGSGYMNIENDILTFQKDDIIILNTGLMHSLYSYKSSIFSTILFDLSLLENIGDIRYSDQTVLSLIKQHTIFKNIIKPTDKGYQDIKKVFDILYCIETNESTPNQLLVLSNIYHFLYYMKKYQFIIENTTFGKTNEFTYLKNAVNFMEQNYFQKLTISMICDHICLSEGYFIRLFKKWFLTTPMIYLNEIRLFHAKRKIKHGANVTEASISCGFDNISYFIKQYKQHYGMTPGEYKKSFTK